MKINSKKPEITIHGTIPLGFTEPKIKTMILNILKLSKATATNIGVAFVSPVKMSSFNDLYRKKNKPTDVLSFAYHESKNPSKNIEGDIIICPSFVRVDIKGSQISYGEQLSRLLVHGILHLSGMDHSKDSEEKRMFAKQEKILKAL